LTACVTRPPRAFDEPPAVREDARIEVGEISIEGEQAPEIDEQALFRAALLEAARERGILWSGDPAEDRYTLSLAIVEYEPGSAFKRWIAPGYGSTILRVEGDLIDARDASVAGKVDHERSVAFGGAYTIGAWERIFDSVADDIMEDLRRRVERTGFVVALVPWSAQATDIPRAATQRTLSITQLTDERPDRVRIGTRKAAFGASMGDVYPSRDVAAYLREVLSDELRGQGHRIVESGPADVVSGDITRFWVRTDTTPLYWDIVAEIELRVSVSSETPSLGVLEKTISCQSEDRTYVYPSAKLVGRVLEDCLSSLMRELRGAMAVGSDG
jgi:uncharacterized lipoprotein YajG